MSHFAVTVAENAELWSAFCLLFQQSAREERERAADGALGLIARGELSRDNVLVTHLGGSITGVTVFANNPGGAGQIWPPQVAPGFPRLALEDALRGEAVRRLRQRGAGFIQALLAAEDLPSAPCLERGGFRRLSALVTLAHQLSAANANEDASCPRFGTRRKALCPRLDYQALPKAGDELFREILCTTYGNTLDFPELNGIRTVDESMEAHRQHGVFHPEHWLVAFDQGAAVGVMILAEMPDRGEWELSYLGVVPAARGRGIGRQLVSEALRRAVQLQSSQLTVAVDARNRPASNLYAGMGFQPLEEHLVYLLEPPI